MTIITIIILNHRRARWQSSFISFTFLLLIIFRVRVTTAAATQRVTLTNDII